MSERCRCCIVGGGPAGMTLGLLLASADVDVLVLEKHADFLRDFSEDTRRARRVDRPSGLWLPLRCRQADGRRSPPPGMSPTSRTFSRRNP